MIFETTASVRKFICKRFIRLNCCLLLGLLVFPASSSAEYFPGPQGILSALQFNSKGEVVTEPQNLSGEMLQAASGSSGETGPPENSSTGGLIVDPYADEAVEEDPFDADAPKGNGFEDDPFAEDEKNVEAVSDPLERWYNRPVYVFNDHFYEYFLRPVTQTYKDFLTENLRIMIRNLFHTVTFPARLVSSLLQLKFEKAGTVVGRVLINCTLGFACMVDVAKEGFGIEPVDEDFGQVLGFYGIPSGPYLVLPLLGPSSARDGVGKAVDALMNPLFWLIPDFTTGAGVTSEQVVNETSFYLDDIKALKEGAIDPYISFRDFYNQRRKVLIDE